MRLEVGSEINVECLRYLTGGSTTIHIDPAGGACLMGSLEICGTWSAKQTHFLNSAPCSDAPGFGFQRLQQDLHDSA